MINAIAPDGFLYKAWWIFEENWPLLWYGLKVTLLLAVIGSLLGLIIGLVLGSIRAIRVEKRDMFLIKVIKRAFRGFASLYIWFFRGTPMMVQALFLYNALRPVLHWSPTTAGIVIISLNTGAYMAEIIRAGIQSIDKGQSEAAKSLGMSSLQMMFSVILPQAIKNSFPSLGNQFIINIKDSSLLNVIGVMELFFQSSSVAGSMMLFTHTFFSTCILYLIVTTLATKLLDFIEKRINHVKTISLEL